MFKIIKDIKKCEEVWKKFSLNSTLWDLWEVNYCFYNPKLFDLYFIVGTNGKEGVLPLWFDKEQDIYGFFGGEFPEKRTFFVKDKKHIQSFIDEMPEHTNLMYIDPNEIKYIEHEGLEPCDTRFFIDLKKFDFDLDNYFKTFNKKHRKNLRYDLRQLEKLDYEIKFGNKKDFEKLIEFNVKRFGKESDFNDLDFVNSMKKLINFLDEKKMLYVISVIINGKIEGVEIAALYNDIYYVFNAGSNREIKNLGKLLIMEHIKNAIKLKVPIVDFLSGESGWKKLWNCEEELLYEV